MGLVNAMAGAALPPAMQFDVHAGRHAGPDQSVFVARGGDATALFAASVSSLGVRGAEEWREGTKAVAVAHGARTGGGASGNTVRRWVATRSINVWAAAGC